MSAGLSAQFREAAAPTEVGECRWCGVLVYSDEPRLSLGLIIWHLSCAEMCRDLLTKSLGLGQMSNKDTEPRLPTYR